MGQLFSPEREGVIEEVGLVEGIDVNVVVGVGVSRVVCAGEAVDPPHPTARDIISRRQTDRQVALTFLINYTSIGAF